MMYAHQGHANPRFPSTSAGNRERKQREKKVKQSIVKVSIKRVIEVWEVRPATRPCIYRKGLGGIFAQDGANISKNAFENLANGKNMLDQGACMCIHVE